MALRQYRANTTWSPKLAYAIGLLTTDGNLSPDGRHINYTSKDEELALTIKTCLNLQNKIGKKASGATREKKYYCLQFGDINFYHFLVNIGLTPAKSKTLKSLKIPHNLFADFLRGCIDGDGNISIARHPESQFPQLRIRLYSGSLNFLKWIKQEVARQAGIKTGWVTDESLSSRIYVLHYAKADSIKLFKYIYYSDVEYYLSRKKTVADLFFSV